MSILPLRPEIVVPDTWRIIPAFTDYAMAPTGDVYRIKRSPRGRYSDIEEPVMLRPWCHPRGIKWYYAMTSDSGKRHRIETSRIKELIHDNDQ
jgi:hypothetical protein